MNAVSRNIRRLRKRDGITQEFLAEKLHVTRQAVSNWETGRTQPDIDTLIAIAAAFGVEETEIIYGERQSGAAPQNKKRLRRATIIFSAVTLVFILTEILLVPYLKQLAGRSYIGYPIMIYNIFLRPLFYGCIPPALFSGLSLVYDLRVTNKTVRKMFTIIGILFVALYAVNAANAFLGIYPNFLMFVFVIPLSENPAIFLLPGMALFFGCNK